MRLKKEDLRGIASRISDSTRRFNLREGMTKEQDSLPERFHKEPLPETGKVVTEEEFAKLLRDYYRLRRWDGEGVPH